MPSYKKKSKSSRKQHAIEKHRPLDAGKMAAVLQKVEVKNKEIVKDDVVGASIRNVEYLDTPAKSEHDRNEYRVIKLVNGLTALLISVPSDDTGHHGACCDVCINVGTFSDPPECPGLAQMSAIAIYNESKKQLQAKDFREFPKITVMTSTGCEETMIRMCMIPEECFVKALNSFSEVLINSTISSDSVTFARTQTELRMSSSLETKNQLFASFAQAGHPATKYATRNRQVLHDLAQETVYEMFLKFRERHYSAHRMTVMIKAQIPLDTLEKHAKECFSTMSWNGLPADDFAEFKGLDPFESMKPQKINIKQAEFDWPLEITWIIPLKDEDQICKAHDYLFWILRYKGEGSLFSYLEKKNWCTDIDCTSSGDHFSCNSLYSTLNLGLIMTEEGRENIRDVLSAVFSYISMLRKEDPMKRIFDEIQRVKVQKFRYMNTCWTETFSKRMQLFPPARYITGNELFVRYDAEAIKFCTNLLTPERMNIITYKGICKSSLDFDFGSLLKTGKTSEEIPDECIQHWKTVEPMPDFHLPKADAFIADNFPTKIYSDSWSEIWYKYEAINLRVGEGYINLHFISPLVMTSPENVAMLDLFASVLKKRVARLKFPGCDMNCDLRPGMKGLWLNVNGFEATVLPLMIKSVVTSISHCSTTMTQYLFTLTKEEQLEQYRRNLMDPVELAEDLRQSMIVSVYWSFVDLHAALLSIGYRQFCEFIKGFVDNVHIQCYAHGRMTKQDVIACVQTCFEILNRGTSNPSSVLNHGVTEIPQGVHCSKVHSFERPPSSSAVTNYYQFDNPSFELATMIDVLSTVMQESAHKPRYCLVRGIYGLYGYSLTGSDRKTRVEDIDEGIEAFRKLFRNTFKNMTRKQLQGVKLDLLLRKEQECAKLEMDLESKVNANWIEIMSEKWVFDRRARELALINEMPTEDLRFWMIKFGVSESDARIRKLSIQVQGYDDTKSVASKSRTKRVGDVKDDFPKICKLNEYKLNYVENRSKDSSRNSSKEKIITDLNDYKRNLKVIPLIRSTL